MKALAKLRSPASCARTFHSTQCQALPRRVVGIPAPPQLQKTGMLFDEDPTSPQEEEDKNEGTSAGHIFLGQQRTALKYMRLIEHDMPNLVRQYMCFL